MKKLFFSVWLFVHALSSGSSFGQVNEYLLNDPVWQVSSACSAPAPCIQYETYNYYTKGDTVFNSLVYKKIFKKGQGYFTWLAPPPNPGCSGSYDYIDTLASYFIRSAGKRMFLRQPWDTVEYLLYDFDLQVGDTLPLSYNIFFADVTVTAIDSFYTSAGYRKRFSLAGNTWSQYLLEGIGHSRGLTEPMHPPLECGFDLTCFSLNDSACYPVQGPTCDIAVGIPPAIKEPAVRVFPNPFSDQLSIHSETFLQGASLTLYNACMKEIQKTDNIFGNTIVIKRQDLSPGMYFIRLEDDQGLLWKGKIIHSY